MYIIITHHPITTLFIFAIDITCFFQEWVVAFVSCRCIHYVLRYEATKIIKFISLNAHIFHIELFRYARVYVRMCDGYDFAILHISTRTYAYHGDCI